MTKRAEITAISFVPNENYVLYPTNPDNTRFQLNIENLLSYIDSETMAKIALRVMRKLGRINPTLFKETLENIIQGDLFD